MMQRDETSLLQPWLEYHGGQFGFENLDTSKNPSLHPIEGNLGVGRWFTPSDEAW
jgi:hypothetical protein